MSGLFRISGIDFLEEDFLDDIREFYDIIPIISEVQNELELQEIECVDFNDCCNKTKDNYFAEIQGYIDDNDEFLLHDEFIKIKDQYEGRQIDLFVIRVYMCKNCGKWIIDILE